MVRRFGIKEKLSPKYVGQLAILERAGNVAYRLALPPFLENVHNIFHVSMLRKCHTDPTQTIELSPQQLEKDLTYAEHPIKSLGMQDRKLRNRVIKFLKT